MKALVCVSMCPMRLPPMPVLSLCGSRGRLELRSLIVSRIGCLSLILAAIFASSGVMVSVTLTIFMFSAVPALLLWSSQSAYMFPCHPHQIASYPLYSAVFYSFCPTAQPLGMQLTCFLKTG
jgi:hypothetical protein